MDGISYYNESPTRSGSRRATLATLAIGAAYIAAMTGLALLLHALGWTPPIIDQLGC